MSVYAVARFTICRGKRIGENHLGEDGFITYFFGPAHCFLDLARHPPSVSELSSDPLLQKQLLDLAVGETVGEITQETKRRFSHRLCSLIVREASLNQLKNRLHVRQQ